MMALLCLFTMGFQMLDISDIYLLQTIARKGSFNKAAEEMDTSQPTLSKRLGRLERHLDIILFHRHNGGVTPTSATRYLIERGARLQGEMRTLERQVELMANLKEGRLNLGVGPIIEQIHLPRILPKFIDVAQNIRVNVETIDPDCLLEMLASGGVDIAIGIFDQEKLSEKLKVIPFGTTKIILVARSGHPVFKEQPPYDVATLQQYPSIAPSIPRYFFKSFDNISPNDVPSIRCDSYATSKEVVRGSDYITGGPETLFLREIKEGHLKKVTLKKDLSWCASCVFYPESEHVPAVNTFLNLLKSL